MHRVILLVLGIILFSAASFLSKSLVFYYGSAMAVGIILVILVVLFQVILILWYLKLDVLYDMSSKIYLY